jgi:hypothetical protein
MDSTSKTDLIPQNRELRKPHFLYRTPDGLGTYLQREVSRALFSRKDALTRFLIPAQLTGPQVKPPKIEYDFEGRAPADFVRMKHLSRAEIAAFKSAAAEFLQKADPDAVEKITPHERELRLHFRLPDPEEEPDAYWLFGPPNDRKLCILWGGELKQNSSLPLLPTKMSAPGASIAERLEARATPWAGLQAQALELLQKNKEPLTEFIGLRVVDAKGQLKSVTIAGKSLPAEAVSAPRYIPAADLRRLAAAATGFYAKAHPDESATSAFEKELRAALRFPDPEKKPGAYVLVRTGVGKRLHVLLDGSETLADTTPIVTDDVLGLPAEEAGPDGAMRTPVPVVDQLRMRVAPKGKFALISGGIAAVAALVVILSGVFTDKTPPRLLEAAAENTATQMRVRFSKPVDPATFYSAEEKAARAAPKPPVIAPKRNFQLKDADGERVEISEITLDPTDHHRVLLKTDRLSDTKDYTLTVRGVADRVGHTPSPDEQTQVRYIDTLPPKLSGDPSADGADSHKIIMKFNKPLDDRFSTAPANFSIPGYLVTKVELSPGEPDTLIVAANNPFKNGERYTMTFSGVTDRARRPNSIREPVTIEFPYINIIPPKVVEIRAERTQVELEVVFSEPVQKGSAETPGNYVISTPGAPDVTASTARLLDDASTIQLRVPALANGKEYTLKVVGIEDRATPPNKIAAGTTVKFTYTGKPVTEPPILADVQVRGDGLRLTVVFNEALDLSTAVAADHYRLDDPAIKVAQVIPKPGDAKTVFLQLDQPLQETKRYRLTVSGLADFVGNVIPASGYTSKPFAGPGLSIISKDVLGIADSTASDDGLVLTIGFTEEVDRASASKVENYSLSDDVKINEVLFDEGTFRQVQLKLNTRLGARRYTLVVHKVGLRSDPARVQGEISQNIGGPGAPFGH